jgi:hypothetical protein
MLVVILTSAHVGVMAENAIGASPPNYVSVHYNFYSGNLD